MTSHYHHSKPDSSAAVDSVASDHTPPPPARWHHDDSSIPPVRLMCSFGGRILPRPQDNQLRYVGGETRIVAVHRSATFSTLLSRLSKLTTIPDITIKYQLPNEDLDALISVTSDEDVENMMEEYDRHAAVRTPRLRLFLFPSDGGGFGSIRDGPTASKHDHWFLDTLNGRPLERGRSEASSIVSEVPDYLFGLDNNSDEPSKPKTNVSVSDPGSPAPATSSPHYGSASSAPSDPPIPDLPPVKTKLETVDAPVEPEFHQQGGYIANPVWQYVPEPIPVYYVREPVPGGGLPVRPVPVPVPYGHRVQPVSSGQIPMGYRQPVPVHGGPVYVSAPPVGRPAMGGVYEYPVGSTAVAADAYELPIHGGLMRNPGVIPMYNPVTGVPPAVGESPTTTGSGRRIGRASQ